MVSTAEATDEMHNSAGAGRVGSRWSQRARGSLPLVAINVATAPRLCPRARPCAMADRSADGQTQTLSSASSAPQTARRRTLGGKQRAAASRCKRTHKWRAARSAATRPAALEEVPDAPRVEGEPDAGEQASFPEWERLRGRHRVKAEKIAVRWHRGVSRTRSASGKGTIAIRGPGEVGEALHELQIEPEFRTIMVARKAIQLAEASLKSSLRSFRAKIRE